MKKRFLLSVIFMLLASSPVLVAENSTGWNTRFTIQPLTFEDDSVTPVLADVVNDTLTLSARFLPGCEFIPQGVNGSSDIDFNVYGSVRQADGAYSITVGVSGEEGIAIVKEIRITRSLELYDYLDDICVPILNELSGRDLTFGSLEFINSGNSGLSGRIMINGRAIDENVDTVNRIPSGTYDIGIEQVSPLGNFTVYSGKVTVEEGETTTVNYALEEIGRLSIDFPSQDWNYQVYLNGSRQPGGTIDFPAGNHRLEVFREYNGGIYSVFNEEVRIGRDAETEVSWEAVELGPGMEFVNRGEDGRYQVEIEERVYQRNPPNIPILPVGDIQVVIRQLFYNGTSEIVFNETVSTKANRPVKVRFRLLEEDLSEPAPEDIILNGQELINSPHFRFITEDRGHYYYAFTANHYTWSEAQKLCEELGGNLFCFSARKEYHKVLESLRQARPEGHVWIGLHQENGDWVWVSGEPLNEARWGQDQPDEEYDDAAVRIWTSMVQTVSKEENSRYRNTWVDDPSFRRFGFILEREGPLEQRPERQGKRDRAR